MFMFCENHFVEIFDVNKENIDIRINVLKRKNMTILGLEQMEIEEIGFLLCSRRFGYCSKCNLNFPKENGEENSCYDIIGKYFKLENNGQEEI